jgi:putative toxin-antitoxin system antitoxin component (TIGR02293 family)
MGTLTQTLTLLGEKNIAQKKNISEADIVQLIRKGLPYAALDRLKNKLKLSEKEIAAVAHIHPRTLARRKSEKRLLLDESDRVYSLASLVTRTIEVLGDEENALVWLRDPNPALGGATPLKYASTAIGAKRVETILAQIEWGDLS